VGLGPGYDQAMDHIAPLVIAGLICAFIGWAIMAVSRRIERRRQRRHADKFGEHQQ